MADRKAGWGRGASGRSRKTPVRVHKSSTDVGVSEDLCSSLVPNGRLHSSGISILDRLIKTCPVWLQLCLSPKQAASILDKEAPGVFLVTRDVEAKCMVLWVRFSEHRDPTDILRYNIREEKTMMYLEGSFLIFEDIFKLVGFYCVSRDILPSPLRMPSVISKAQTLKDLETLSNLGSGFWDSSIRGKISSLISHSGKSASFGHGQSKDQPPSDSACEIELSAGSGRLWFVNPIFIEECGNAQTCDKLPLTNSVAQADAQLPKVVYRRPPPPPPPLLHKPPLPSVPPSAPPPDIHQHSHFLTFDPPRLASTGSTNSSDLSLISPTESEPLPSPSPTELLPSKTEHQPPPSQTELLPFEPEPQPTPFQTELPPTKTDPQPAPSQTELLPFKTETQPPSTQTELLPSKTEPLLLPSQTELLNSQTKSLSLSSPSEAPVHGLVAKCPLSDLPSDEPPTSILALDTLPADLSEPSPTVSYVTPSPPDLTLNDLPSDTKLLESDLSIALLNSPTSETDISHFSPTALHFNQVETSAEQSSTIKKSSVTHNIEKPPLKMRISNPEEKKEISGNEVHPSVSPVRTPVRVPPAVPKRRPSGKTPENVSNAFSVKHDPQEKTNLMSSELKNSISKAKPLTNPADTQRGSSLQQKVVSPRLQQKSHMDGKKTPPVPPPRLKKLSSKHSSAEGGRRKLDPKYLSETQQSSKSSEIHKNAGSVKIRDKKERQKSLVSKDLKGSDSSLNSPTSGPNTPSSNPELDSNSASSAEEDCDRPTGTSIKKSHSFMLDRAKNRLSIVAITNVFSAFMSADRRLQMRITELAHDKDSYFGNLVQDYKAYSLEMMAKQSSSTEMLQEIRLMMTQLKSYLVQSTELKSIVDYNLYTDDKIDVIVEAALCKCVLKPLKSPIECYLREIHNKEGSMRLLTENQLVIQDTTTTDLGISTSVPDSGVMEKITQKFATMHKTYSPEKKITYLLKACKLIYDSMASGNPGKHHGADDFLPVLMYVLARCDLVALLLDVEYMMELMDPSLQLGEGSYYLTTTYGALEHIKNYDKITVTRTLSLEVQDSIHRWERRRTLNKARVSRSSIQDFITISFEELEVNTRTLATKPDTKVAQVLQQCAEKFEVSEPHKYGLFVLVNEKFYCLANDALPQQVKSRLLKNEQKLDFHFLYKTMNEQDTAVKDLDFLQPLHNEMGNCDIKHGS